MQLKPSMGGITLSNFPRVGWFIVLPTLPSKRLHNYGKSPFSMGKSTISMAHFQ